METNWAAEHLQTIRTLMERSALYRRALAPISTFVGVVGILAAMVGWALKINTVGTFALYWMAVGVVAVVGALFLVRSQSVKQGENFWSPPTRRVAQAMSPALLAGLILGSLAVAYMWPNVDFSICLLLISTWTLLYGLALHAAGFFMPRGVRLFSWGFTVSSLALVMAIILTSLTDWNVSPHWLMGLLFGVSHLMYGVYLYFTESRKNET